MTEHVITAGPAFKETRQSGPFTETITSAENVNIPARPVSTQPTITPEMIEAYQRQQAEAEQKARHALLRELVALAQERGYQIIAAPQIEEGKLVAIWGVAPLAR